MTPPRSDYPYEMLDEESMEELDELLEPITKHIPRVYNEAARIYQLYPYHCRIYAFLWILYLLPFVVDWLWEFSHILVNDPVFPLFLLSLAGLIGSGFMIVVPGLIAYLNDCAEEDLDAKQLAVVQEVQNERQIAVVSAVRIQAVVAEDGTDALMSITTTSRQHSPLRIEHRPILPEHNSRSAETWADSQPQPAATVMPSQSSPGVISLEPLRRRDRFRISEDAGDSSSKSIIKLRKDSVKTLPDVASGSSENRSTQTDHAIDPVVLTLLPGSHSNDSLFEEIELVRHELEPNQPAFIPFPSASITALQTS